MMKKINNESIEFDDDDRMIYDPSKSAEEVSVFKTEGDVVRAKNAGVIYYYAYAFDFKTLNQEWGDTKFAKEVKLKYIKRIRYPVAEDEDIIKKLVVNSVEKYINKKGIPKIIIPIASKSKINGWICDAFKEKNPDIIELKDSIIKALNKYVELKKQINTPESAKYTLKRLSNRYGDREFEIKKITGKLRQFFTKFLTSNPSFIEDLNSIKGEDVLLVDDSINVGATFHDAIREIKKYGPSKIEAFIFLKEAKK